MKNNGYEAEVKERWGNTDAYCEYREKTKDYTGEKRASVSEEMDGIFARFAKYMASGANVDSDVVQDLVRALQDYITENFYNCTDYILAGLGQMYVYDERFKKNIDKHGEGTAEFAAEVIKIYYEKKEGAQ